MELRDDLPQTDVPTNYLLLKTRRGPPWKLISLAILLSVAAGIGFWMYLH